MIGVAVSTHRRPHILAQALAGWAQHMPDILVVNHDRAGMGVAATKNQGIAALMDAGCDQLFLADDDVWPVTPDWALPYILSPEPHLMHCWGKKRHLATTGELSVWSWPRGVLLYLERRVVERVGGMRTEFKSMGEHVEYSRRIHNTGLTRHRFADVAAAKHGHWHCEDYVRATPSSIPHADRANTALRHELYEKYRHSTDFVDYRQDVYAV